MRLTLKGFQSHEDTSLDIRGHLVCVTGPNNVGKSAIVRAVRWLFYDALRGTKFVRKGGDQASVEAEINGRLVARIKGRKSSDRNAYVVDGSALESIGTGAPEEVEEATGISRARIDKDLELELNVVRQKEHPFLMEETGTAKAKILNALTGLHVLDVAIRSTVAAIRSLRGEEKSLSSSIESLGTQMLDFSDLPAKEKAVASSRSSLEACIVKRRDTDAAWRDLDMLRQSKAESARLNSIPIPDLSAIETLTSRKDELESKTSAGRSLLSEYKKWKSAAYSVSEEPAGRADMTTIENLWSSYESLWAKISDMHRHKEHLEMASGAEFIASSHLKTAESHLAQTEKELNSMAGKPCSECGRPLDSNCLAEAV